MKQKRKSKILWTDECAECGKEVSGETQPMVNVRMRMHMITHKKKGVQS